MSLIQHTVNSKNAVGEVANVDDMLIDIFLYPEYFGKIKVGNIIIVDSEGDKPIGIVLRLSHSPKAGSITPLRESLEKLRKRYPDYQYYLNYVTTIVYTSHYSDNEVRHCRSHSPHLHELAYLVEDKTSLKEFLMPKGVWDTSFLINYLQGGARPFNIIEFVENNSVSLKNLGDVKGFVKSVARTLAISHIDYYGYVINKIMNILGVE
ncbi:hypothetical protein B6U74_02655 [Candidatus Bathyarchaeota archaeon ex4484_205]|nr:MAG: hypothetical protein B6U74_02655 [Candidatus Bathyarchaeota archaeon ex4484_205]